MAARLCKKEVLNLRKGLGHSEKKSSGAWGGTRLPSPRVLRVTRGHGEKRGLDFHMGSTQFLFYWRGDRGDAQNTPGEGGGKSSKYSGKRGKEKFIAGKKINAIRDATIGGVRWDGM